MTDLSIIGLGAMGRALGEAALAAGHGLTVWNRSAGKAGALVARGAHEAQTAGGAAAAAQLIVVCVLDYAAVGAVVDEIGAGLAGRTLVNLTNGTPAQARAMVAKVSALGGRYLDGGIMAVPPMIATPAALVLYSGGAALFEAHRPVLEAFGRAQHVGEDAGLAAAFDLALLSGMYGLFGGALQAFAVAGAESIRASDLLPLLMPWLSAMGQGLPDLAVNIDSGRHDQEVTSNLAMQSVALNGMLVAFRERGIDVSLLQPMASLMRERVARGHGADDTSGVFELIRPAPASVRAKTGAKP